MGCADCGYEPAKEKWVESDGKKKRLCKKCKTEREIARSRVGARAYAKVEKED